MGATEVQDPPAGRPEATIDLATNEGVKLVKGEWRYSDTKIIEVGFRAPGPDGQPTGAPIRPTIIRRTPAGPTLTTRDGK